MTRASSDDTWSYVLDARISHVRTFRECLLAIKIDKHSRARVRADERGVTFATRDGSKTCAASVNFRAEVFASYACDDRGFGGRHDETCAFEVNLTSLIDVLGAFAARDGDGDARLRWPNREGAVSLELSSARATGERDFKQCIYSEIAPEASNDGDERGEELSFRDEANAFMLPTATLKEIVDDLEWPASDVQIDVDVGALRFSGYGAGIGELKIDVDTEGGRLTEFTCRQASTSRYKYRFLKSATTVGASFLGASAGGSDENVTMTRVAISNTGFLKIVHLLHLSRSVSFGSTGGLNELMVPVTFILCPILSDGEMMDDGESEEV